MEFWPRFKAVTQPLCAFGLRRSFTNCLEMLVFGTNWKTRHSVVCQPTCTSGHKMYSGMRQMIGSYVSSEVEHLSPSVGCVKNKRQYLTVPQSLKSCL